MKYIRVYVDPNLKEIYTDPLTFKHQYRHMSWCHVNCKYEWFNDCNEYSNICFSNPKEALKFALEWSKLSEEEKVLAILKWS
jgi:hypothetical protein